MNLQKRDLKKDCLKMKLLEKLYCLNLNKTAIKTANKREQRQMVSFSEMKYLKMIYLNESSNLYVPNCLLSKLLNVRPSSVTGMLQKLEKKN